MKGSCEESTNAGGRRIAFVALPNFFAESMLVSRYRLRERPFVVSTGEGDRALILDTYNLPLRGLVGVTLGRLRKLLPLEVPGRDAVVPDIIPVDDGVLQDMDRRTRLLLKEYTPVIESRQAGQYHIDLGRQPGSRAARAATEIAGRLGDWFRFSARLGVGSNKLIAYLAGRSSDPGRAQSVAPGREAEFFRPLSLLLLPLAWKLKQELYASYNLRTIGDLAAFEREELTRVFGPRGATLYEYARGIAPAELTAAEERAWLSDRVQVSTRLENDDDLARARFSLLVDRLSGRLRAGKLFPGRFALDFVYQDDYRTRSERRLRGADNLAGTLRARLAPELERALRRRIALKRIQLAFADCTPAWWQYDLYEDGADLGRERELSSACDAIRSRFGDGAIRRASQM